MRLKRGAWDGAQPRSHVLKVLRGHGVAISAPDGDYYTMVDLDGDVEVLHLPQPVLSETVAHIYRRFGELHGFEITELVAPRPKPN